MSNALTYAEYKRRQGLPLSEKMQLTDARIDEWYEAHGGNVVVLSSGGMDSGIVVHRVHLRYPEVPVLHVNTGLEYPELEQMVKRTKNITILRPKMPFHKVIKVHGWPVISKKWAKVIRVLRYPEEKQGDMFRLYDTGINSKGEKTTGWKLAQRWRFLIDAPFKIGDGCCDVMKKEPFKRYKKETGRGEISGMMACESRLREIAYTKNGCNAFDTASPKSTPIAFWTKNDVLEYTKAHNLPYPSVYGEIIQHGREFKTTGVSRTGCIFCCFGLHLEGIPNRFQQLYFTHPKLWDYCMNTLGLADVLRYMRVNGDPRIAWRLASKPYPLYQASLPEVPQVAAAIQ